MIKFFVDAYQNPWKRLVLYIIVFGAFFFYIFTTFQFGPLPVQEVESDQNLTSTTSLDNYRSTYHIQFLESIGGMKDITLNAVRFGDDEVYKSKDLNDHLYREKEEIYADSTGEISDFVIHLESFVQEKWKEYQKVGTQSYKTEYRDGKVETAYEIPLSDFSQIYDEKVKQKGTIILKIIEKDQIESVSLDMSDYYLVKIDIEYQDYNQVTEEDVLDVTE